jgi:hypothetical protein
VQAVLRQADQLQLDELHELARLAMLRYSERRRNLKRWDLEKVKTTEEDSGAHQFTAIVHACGGDTI